MDSSSGAVKLRACFVEEDQGLASLADMGTPHQIQPHPFFSRRTSTSYRSPSFRALRSLPGISSNSIINHNTCNNSNNNSPRSGVRFYDGRFEDGIYQQQQQPHFLEACALCRKPLGDNRDIFMYRGDTPFCSEECRQEQIEIDEAKEKIQSSKALRKDTPNSTTPSKSRNYPFRTGTVAAA